LADGREIGACRNRRQEERREQERAKRQAAQLGCGSRSESRATP
jgi:hypothetical protein